MEGLFSLEPKTTERSKADRKFLSQLLSQNKVP